MKRALALALCLCLALTACGEEAAPTPTPTPAAASPTPTAAVDRGPFTLPRTGAALHPMLTQDRLDLALSGLIWEGLFELDRQFVPQNSLCASYTTSEDGLTWTFTLDAAAQFSDGEALAASHVVASLTRAMAPDSRFAARLSNVAAVTATPEGAVAVTLKTPNGALPALLDIPIVKDAGGDTPLGTGPYVLAADGASLTPHAAWWRNRGKTPTADIVALTTVTQADELIRAFHAGELDLVTTDLTGSSALGLAGGSYEPVDYLTTTLLYLGCNAKSGLCREREVRQAVQAAVDRRSVCGLLEGHATAAALPVHPANPAYDSDLVSDKLPGGGSAVQAEELLQVAGWARGEDGVYRRRRSILTLRLLVNQENSHRVDIAQQLAEDLAEAGIAVTVEKKPWNSYTKALEQGDFDLYLAETTLTADFDLTPLLGEDSPLNYGLWRWDADAQALWDACRASPKTAAKPYYAYLLDEAPIISLCFKNHTALYPWGALQNPTPTQQNIFYRFSEWKLP